MQSSVKGLVSISLMTVDIYCICSLVAVLLSVCGNVHNHTPLLCNV